MYRGYFCVGIKVINETMDLNCSIKKHNNIYTVLKLMYLNEISLLHTTVEEIVTQIMRKFPITGILLGTEK